MGDATRNFVSQWTQQEARGISANGAEDLEVQWRSVQRVSARCQPTPRNGDEAESVYANDAAPQWLGWACAADRSTSRRIETIAVAAALGEGMGLERRERVPDFSFARSSRVRPHSATTSRPRASRSTAVNLDIEFDFPAENRSRPQSAKQPRPSPNALLSSMVPPQIKDSKWTEMMFRSPDFQQKSLIRLEMETYELLQSVFRKERRAVAQATGLKKQQQKKKKPMTKNKQNAVALKSTKASEAKQQTRTTIEDGYTVKRVPCGSAMHLARDRKQNGLSGSAHAQEKLQLGTATQQRSGHSGTSSLNQVECGDSMPRTFTPRQLARKTTKRGKGALATTKSLKSEAQKREDEAASSTLRNEEDAAVRDRVLLSEIGWSQGEEEDKGQVDRVKAKKQARGRFKHGRPKEQPKQCVVASHGHEMQSSAPEQSSLDVELALDTSLSEPMRPADVVGEDAELQLVVAATTVVELRSEDELEVQSISNPGEPSDRSLPDDAVDVVDPQSRQVLLHEGAYATCGDEAGDGFDAPDLDEDLIILSDSHTTSAAATSVSSQLEFETDGEQLREQLLEPSRSMAELQQEAVIEGVLPEAATSPSTLPTQSALDSAVMECGPESEQEEEEELASQRSEICASPSQSAPHASQVFDTNVLECKPSASSPATPGGRDSPTRQQTGGFERQSDDIELDLKLTDAKGDLRSTEESVAEIVEEDQEDEEEVYGTESTANIDVSNGVSNADNEGLSVTELPAAEAAPERPADSNVERDPHDPYGDAVGDQEIVASSRTELQVVGHEAILFPEAAEQLPRMEEQGERAVHLEPIPDPASEGETASDLEIEADVAGLPAASNPAVEAEAPLECAVTDENSALAAIAIVSIQCREDQIAVTSAAERVSSCEDKGAALGVEKCAADLEDSPQAVPGDAVLSNINLPTERVNIACRHGFDTRESVDCEQEDNHVALSSSSNVAATDNANGSEPISSWHEIKSPRGMDTDSVDCGGQAAASSARAKGNEEEEAASLIGSSSLDVVVCTAPVASDVSPASEAAPVIEEDPEVCSLLADCEDAAPAPCSEENNANVPGNEMADRKGEKLSGADSEGDRRPQSPATTPLSSVCGDLIGDPESAEGSGNGEVRQVVHGIAVALPEWVSAVETDETLDQEPQKDSLEDDILPPNELETVNPRNEDSLDAIDGISTRREVEIGGPEVQMALDTGSAARRIQQQYRCFVQRQVLTDQLTFLVSQHHRQVRKKTRHTSTEVMVALGSLPDRRMALPTESSDASPGNASTGPSALVGGNLEHHVELGDKLQPCIDELASSELSSAVEHTVEPQAQSPEPSHHSTDDEAEIIATEACRVEVQSAAAVDDDIVGETIRYVSTRESGSEEAGGSYDALAPSHEDMRAQEEEDEPVVISAGVGEEQDFQPGWPGESTPAASLAELFENGDLYGEDERRWSFSVEPLLAVSQHEDPGNSGDNDDAKLRSRAASIALAALAFDDGLHDYEYEDPEPPFSHEVVHRTDESPNEATSSSIPSATTETALLKEEAAVSGYASTAGHWERYMDAATDRSYYFNPSTQVSQWTLPEGSEYHQVVDTTAALDDAVAMVDISAGPSVQAENEDEAHLQQQQEAWHQVRSQSLWLENFGGWDKFLMAKGSTVFFYHEGRDEYFVSEESSTGAAPLEFSEAQAQLLCEQHLSPAVPAFEAEEAGLLNSYVEAPEDGHESDMSSIVVERWSLRRNVSQSAEKRGDWQAFVDAESHQLFYYNAHTGESSWEKPAVFEEPSSTASTDAAKYDWVTYMDDASGTAYYVNLVTGETSWDKPEDFDRATARHEAHEEEASHGGEDEYVIRIDEQSAELLF